MSQDPRELIGFLSSSLANFMASNRHNNQKWTKYRVASYITGSEEITGSISDTTLGRFLDPDYPQQPSPATTKMIAEFLLLHKWISEIELELLGAPKDVQIAASLSRFFDVGETRADKEFIKKLAGNYANYILRAPYLLETQFYITAHEQENLLTCYETMKLYRIHDTQQLGIFTQCINEKNFGRMPSLIKALGTKLELTHTFTGAGVAGAGLISFLLKPRNPAFNSVIALDAINLNADDQICMLSGSRNRGWVALDEEETLPPYDKISTANAYQALRYLSGKVEYYPQLISEIQHMRVAGKADHDEGEVRKFYGKVPVLPSDQLRNKQHMDRADKEINAAANADEKLRLSMEWGRLDHFKAALEQGADNEMTGEGHSLPLIFGLASKPNGLEWVKTLVEVGKCDLLVKDERGLPPSCTASAWADRLSKFPGTEKDVKDFEEIARYIYIQQLKQLEVKNNVPGFFDDILNP